MEPQKDNYSYSQTQQKTVLTGEQIAQIREKYSDGDKSIVREISLLTARTISEQVENRDSSEDPLAWKLKRITVSRDRIGIEELHYLLEPPQEMQEKFGIRMIYTSNGPYANGNHIAILYDSSEQNPYEKFASNSAKKASIITNQQFFDDLLSVSELIQIHGIQREGCTFQQNIEGSLSLAFRTHLDQLQFTNKQTPSSNEELMHQQQEGVAHPIKPVVLSTRQGVTPVLAPEQAPVRETKPTPNKPLAECTIEDLKDLTEEQLHELLFRASIYRDRTFNIENSKEDIIYRLHIESPSNASTQTKNTSPLVGDLVSNSGKRTIEIGIPHKKGKNEVIFNRELLPIINKQLQERGLPALPPIDNFYQRKAWKLLNCYWSNNPYEALDRHDYMDGRLYSEHETLQGLLAKEVRDLQALGLDFTDIINAIDPIMQALDYSTDVALKRKPTAGEDHDLTFHATQVYDRFPKTIYHQSNQDPTIIAATTLWMYDVISLPFPQIEGSTSDHTLAYSSLPAEISLSDTTFELYKNRIIEGVYTPNYRISAARTVWALQIGTPELQAKAFALDWDQISKALEMAEQNGNIDLGRTILQYLRYFPNNSNFWKKHGFSGYQYAGKVYEQRSDIEAALKSKFWNISFINNYHNS